MPSGPHGVGHFDRAVAERLGAVFHGIDLDPRWVKKLAARGPANAVAPYVEHVVEQARFVLETQSVANLHARQLDYLKTGRDMIGQVTDDFEDAFVHLALMPEAENQLISQLVNLRQRLTDLWSQPGEVEARLQSVVHALEVLAGDVGASR